MLPVLDMCCGSRMFWINKADPRALYMDIRRESHILNDGRGLHINPEIIADFRNLPFSNETFYLVVFDPPHLKRAGKQSYLLKKYGKLTGTWEQDIKSGFHEAFRVLRANGLLVFKWSETQIPVSKIIPLSPYTPVIWQRTGKNDKTHFVIFIKN